MLLLLLHRLLCFRHIPFTLPTWTDRFTCDVCLYIINTVSVTFMCTCMSYNRSVVVVQIYLWAPIYRENWSAFAPDFEELEENREYVEREDEFDINEREEDRLAAAAAANAAGVSHDWPWAAWYNTWLLMKLTPKGVVLSFLFFSFSFFS